MEIPSRYPGLNALGWYKPGRWPGAIAQGEFALTNANKDVGNDKRLQPTEKARKINSRRVSDA